MGAFQEKEPLFHPHYFTGEPVAIGEADSIARNGIRP
jgi:hypothetical protein